MAPPCHVEHGVGAGAPAGTRGRARWTRGSRVRHLRVVLDQKVTEVAGGEQRRGGARRCTVRRRYNGQSRGRSGPGGWPAHQERDGGVGEARGGQRRHGRRKLRPAAVKTTLAAAIR
jgi:hypothetical protein